MTNFELKGNKHYRLSKGSGKRINNGLMSDELAIEFLSIDPTRIKVFAKYPENWADLIDGDYTVEDEVEDVVEPSTDGADMLLAKEALRQYKLPELREMYPGIRNTSKEGFISEILNK